MSTDQPKTNDLVLHDEELSVEKEVREIGAVRLLKTVETEHVSEPVELVREYAEIDRVPPNDEESGEIETLPDGSLSIPVLAEELVLSKRVVVVERVVVRRSAAREEHAVEADLKRERLEVDVTDDR